MNIRKPWLHAAALATTATLLAACGGGSSDVAGGGDDGGGAETTLTLVAYAVPEARLEQDHPGVRGHRGGQGRRGYHVLRRLGRPVAQGRRRQARRHRQLLRRARRHPPGQGRTRSTKDWNADATKGIPFGSVVTLVVRKGNPKDIKDWDDLLQPGLEVVTPNPLSSGSAKWNLLAPYAAKSNGGKNPQAGLDYVTKLVTEHVKTQPQSGREATDVFLQGTGDVLISYENEAIFIERQGEPVEHVNPPQTFKIENPVAVVTSSAHLRPGQGAEELPVHRRGPEALGRRPASGRSTRRSPRSSPTTSRRRRSCGPSPTSVAGETVDPALFDKDNGAITKIYKQATG